MQDNLLPLHSHIRVTSYGPFRGLKGIIQSVDVIVDDLEDPFCFYAVVLEGATILEPIWFAYHEVEFIGSPPPMLRPQTQGAGVDPWER